MMNFRMSPLYPDAYKAWGLLGLEAHLPEPGFRAEGSKTIGWKGPIVTQTYGMDAVPVPMPKPQPGWSHTVIHLRVVAVVFDHDLCRWAGAIVVLPDGEEALMTVWQIDGVDPVDEWRNGTTGYSPWTQREVEGLEARRLAIPDGGVVVPFVLTLESQGDYSAKRAELLAGHTVPEGAAVTRYLRPVSARWVPPAPDNTNEEE